MGKFWQRAPAPPVHPNPKNRHAFDFPPCFYCRQRRRSGPGHPQRPGRHLVGFTSTNKIARIDTANFAGATATAITGLAAGDRFAGIDLRPKNNKIYGVTLSNQPYTVDEMTGATSLVAALSSAVISPSLGYGIDFNPLADFGPNASLTLINSAGGNFAINATTGAVTTATSIAAGFSAVSYTNSVPLPSVAPAPPSLNYINSSSDTLRIAPSNFNSPTITTVGALGVDVLKANGFEVLANGTAYAALNTDDGSSLVTGVYSINLGTGAATLVGSYNGTLSGLTVTRAADPCADAGRPGGDRQPGTPPEPLTRPYPAPAPLKRVCRSCRG